MIRIQEVPARIADIMNKIIVKNSDNVLEGGRIISGSKAEMKSSKQGHNPPIPTQEKIFSSTVAHSTDFRFFCRMMLHIKTQG
mgnify:CR=1 FL=1